MARPTRALIDLKALAHNASLLRDLSRDRQLMAVVKADAYGHGATHCARILQPLVDAFAVAFLEEAIALREKDIEKPVLVLEGPMEAGEIDYFLRSDFWSVIHRSEQLDWFQSEASGRRPSLWLKVDTGMHRLGLPMSDLKPLMKRANSFAKVTLCSHLANAGNLDHPVSRRQLSDWGNLRTQYTVPSSLLNSASTLLRDSDTAHWIRPGYLLYGGQPEGLSSHLSFKPVMQFQSAVIAVRTIEKGEQVGYGGRWTANGTSRIATLPVGYADGYPRSTPDGTPVVVAGHTVPIAGRVSMDMITVDITGYPDIDVGAPAVLWGDTPTVDTIADAAGTIGYELCSQINHRVPRFYTSV